MVYKAKRAKAKPVYQLSYSDGTRFYSYRKEKPGLAGGEAGEMGIKITKVKRINNPSVIQRFRAYAT